MEKELELVKAEEFALSPKYSWRELSKLASREALERIPVSLARKYSVLPVALLRSDPPTLTLLTNRTLELEDAREMRFAADAELIVEEIACDELSLAIESAYRCQLSHPPAPPRLRTIPPPSPSSIDGPIPSLLTFILESAFSRNASDIHFEPDNDSLSVRFRIDGRLMPFDLPTFDCETANSLSRRVKVLAEIDLARIGVPTDGSFHFSFGATTVHVRVSTLPTIDGEKVVLRLHCPDSERPAAPEELGLHGRMLEQFRLALATESGAILLSGPTGSGKTSLLYSALASFRHSGKNVVTLEDPVEKRIAGISQTSIDHGKGLDSATLLRSILRQDPDILMIGEIRDQDTARTALSAALTGHLLLSTVHATTVFDIITRLRQFASDDDLLAKALRLLISQRLLPLNCPRCKKEALLPKPLCTFFGVESGTSLWEATGCQFCSETRFSGRIAVYEMLSLNEALRELIRSRAPESALAYEASRTGYRPLRFEIRERMLRGEISASTALSALGVPQIPPPGESLPPDAVRERPSSASYK